MFCRLYNTFRKGILFRRENIKMGIADNKYIDLASGLLRVAKNEALYKKLIAKFETSIDISAFDAAYNACDYVKLGEIVHAAKGIAGNLSLTAFYYNSVILMEQLRGGGAPEQTTVDVFRHMYDETVRAINEYLS